MSVMFRADASFAIPEDRFRPFKRIMISRELYSVHC